MGFYFSILILDYASVIIYTTRLLQRLHRYLSSQEQAELSEILKKVVIASNGGQNDIASKHRSELVAEIEGAPSKILVKDIMGGAYGIPLLRKLEICP